MELEDLKNDWESIDKDFAGYRALDPGLIDHITEKKYHSTLRKIKYPELAGAIICTAAIIFIIFNFGKLHTAFLEVTGIAAIVLLVMLIFISQLSVAPFNLPANADESYVETIKRFASRKLRFQRYQRVNVILCYIFLVATIILLPALFYGKDISGNRYFQTIAFSSGYIFLLFFSGWVNKYYNKSLNQAEELLREATLKGDSA